MRAIILSIVLALTALSAQAAVYKWVDQNGKTHYSDKPAQNAEQVKVGPAAKAEPAEPGKEGEAKPEQPKGETDAHLQVRTQKCELARRRVADYQESSGLYMKDEFGEQRELSPEEQVQAIVDMQKNVDSFCVGIPEAEPAEGAEIASP